MSSFAGAPATDGAEQAPTFKITIGAGYRYDPTAWKFTDKSDDLDNFAKLIKAREINDFFQEF